ncbi:WXG100 family type VII secretion target [Streptomyces yangpuensis]|uniref:WXG100 family type VII secretion target n=1 Tax=Streptomyces yangpuensis TaxID=1648182 RepID=UPI0035DD9AC4
MTNFEGYTHAQLHAMIESLDPAKVAALGTKLTEAATTIEQIGTKLKDHKVKGWEGEGATAFQNWVSQSGSATLQLADYSKAGGKYMAEAAQVMREVKPSKDGVGNFPPYDAAADAKLRENLTTSREYHNDPDAVQLGQEAWRKLSGDHARAVDAMNKLAGAYDQSAVQMGKAEIPTFPPPPDVLVPPAVYDSQDLQRSSGGPGGGAGSSGSSYSSTSPDYASRSSGSDSMPGNQPRQDNTVPSVSVPSIPDRDVDVDLDTVGTLPPPTTPPVTTTPGLPPTTGPVGPTPGPFVPPVAIPPVGGLKGPGPFGTGPGIGPYPGLGGPGVPPGGKVIGTPGLPPRDAGITGGRPVTSTGPASGIPRGMVVGEGTQAGRPMGGGMGHGGGHYGGTQAGLPAGRRLATEPGGVMGGRQAGAVGRPIAAGQPFTQGGSGLVRNGAGPMGHAGAGMQTPGRGRDNQEGQRPDYLTEDEETWQGNRRVAPPVID